MDTFHGRRTSNGTWCAWGPAAELAEHASRGDVVEVYTPTRHVAHVRITRVGTAWTVAGTRVCYGYLEDASTEAGVA